MRIRRRGAAMLETVMWLPMLVSLLFGMVELARVSYTYYTLHKILYAIASDVGHRSGIDFCNAETNFDTAKNFALRGGVDDTTDTIVPNLVADQIAVAFERVDTTNGSATIIEYTPDCAATANGPGPDYVTVSIPDGYPIRLVFPTLLLDPIPLRPKIRIPFGGVS